MKPRVTTASDGCAWVTGASSGIGAATAKALAAEGWTVAVTARRLEELETLRLACAGLKGTIKPYPCDVSDRAAMAATVAAIESACGPVALAVLNAGIYLPVDGLKPDPELFRRSFDVNAMGTVYGLAPLVPLMVARGYGHLCIVSSVTGYGGLPTSAAYGATKAALINMAESLKFDLDKAGVLISVVNPGFVKTPATDSNEFKMPFLVAVDTAARRIVRGLKSGRFEITFPRRFTWQLKFVNILPYWLYFRVVGATTGAGKN